MAKVIKDPERNETKSLHKAVDFTGRRVLEIGCGEGRLTWRYAGASLSTLGIDPDKNALRLARADCPSDLSDKVRFVNCTAEQLPFRKETFDIAILAWSL